MPVELRFAYMGTAEADMVNWLRVPMEKQHWNRSRLKILNTAAERR